jgi:hypothetical protein
MQMIQKPQPNSEPLHWEQEGKRVSAFLVKNGEALTRLLQGGPRVLDEDEIENRLGEIDFFLFNFILECAALPVQSPQKLSAELKRIIRDPEAFIRDPAVYIPEVKARVYRWYYKDLLQDLQIVQQYELDRGTLDPMKVISAAERAFREINEQRSKGRPTDELLRGFAIGLAEIFERTGQQVRTTPNGRFWQFVELLTKAVYFNAKFAGSKFTVRSIVEIAYAQLAKRKI